MKFLILGVFSISSLLISATINIDLEKQLLTVVDNNKVILKSKITSGRIGHETPRGTFKIIGKERMHISNLYPVHEDGTKGGAKMPYMLRLTNYGVAIHAGEMVEYPDSHGCIRVPYGKAMKLFKIIPIGTKVVIKNRPKFNDRINLARIEEIKTKKSLSNNGYSHKTKHKKHNRRNSYSVDNENVKWVENAFSYYDDM